MLKLNSINVHLNISEALRLSIRHETLIKVIIFIIIIIQTASTARTANLEVLDDKSENLGIWEFSDRFHSESP